MPPVNSIAVSPSLCSLIADRRLMSADDRVYRPRPQRSPAAVLVALLLLLGGVENNPGPPSTVNDAAQLTARHNSTSVGLLNKAAVIHDVIADHHLDVPVMTET